MEVAATDQTGPGFKTATMNFAVVSEAVHIVLNMSQDNGRYVGSPAAESVSVNPRHGDTSLAASPNTPHLRACT